MLSPASGVRDAAALRRGLERFRKWGLKPTLMPHATSDGASFDTNALVLELVGSVQALIAQNAALQQRVHALESTLFTVAK